MPCAHRNKVETVSEASNVVLLKFQPGGSTFVCKTIYLKRPQNGAYSTDLTWFVSCRQRLFSSFLYFDSSGFGNFATVEELHGYSGDQRRINMLRFVQTLIMSPSVRLSIALIQSSSTASLPASDPEASTLSTWSKRAEPCSSRAIGGNRLRSNSLLCLKGRSRRD